jgi:hypothetical protein
MEGIRDGMVILYFLYEAFDSQVKFNPYPSFTGGNWVFGIFSDGTNFICNNWLTLDRQVGHFASCSK